MIRFADAVKSIKAELAKGESYDAGVVTRAAAVLEGGAGAHLVKLYPAGTGHAPSEAKAEIWQEPEAFAAASDRLAAAATNLGAAADAAEANIAFKAVLESCGACHKRFREKR